MSAPGSPHFRCLCTGDEAFAAMLNAIAAARESVRLEVYIFKPGPLAEKFLSALTAARERGARVQVLVDAWGSLAMDAAFWQPLQRAGGEFRWFNPPSLKRGQFRDHRKTLVCDDRVALIGGFNIMPECEGDGVTRGWRDLGLAITGPLVADLAAAFDEMFALAEFRHKHFMRLRRTKAAKAVRQNHAELLLSGPGRGFHPIKRALNRDFARAASLQIIAAYFLPSWRMRRQLIRLARRGGRVQLILAARSDVPLMQLAGQGLYHRLLRAGVEIYEYQPQILHAKLIIADDAVYLGSANLDTRSLNINYELLVRAEDAPLREEARGFFNQCLALSRRIEPVAWRKSCTLWMRLKQRLAYFVLARMDPYVARWQLRLLRERALPRRRRRKPLTPASTARDTRGG